MAKITFTLTHEKVRKVIARLTGRRQEDILARHKLIEDFGFNDIGFSRLRGKLIDEFQLFSVTLTQQEISNSGTVNGILQLVWSKIPEGFKETTLFTEHLFSVEGLIDAFSDEISKTSEAKRIERIEKK